MADCAAFRPSRIWALGGVQQVRGRVIVASLLAGLVATCVATAPLVMAELSLGKQDELHPEEESPE